MEVDVKFFLSWGDELNADRRETLVFAGLLECLDFCLYYSTIFLTLYEMLAFAVSSLSST